MIKTTHNTNTIHDTTEFLKGYFKHIDSFHDSLYYKIELIIKQIL